MFAQWWLGEVESCLIGEHVADIVAYVHPTQLQQPFDKGSQEHIPIGSFEGRGFFLTPLDCSRTSYQRIKKGIQDFAMRGDSVINPAIYEGIVGYGKLPVRAKPAVEASKAKAVVKQTDFFNQQLDDMQQQAVQLAVHQFENLESHPCPATIIQGPPGTGKTETVIEIVRQIKKVAEKEQAKYRTVIQVCFPTNAGAIRFCKRLGEHGEYTLWDTLCLQCNCDSTQQKPFKACT